MRKGFVPAALCALTLAAPATAERFYVPVLGTTAADGSALATRVWVANAEGVESPVAARFHAAAPLEGDERVVTARAEGRLLTDLAPAGKAGLIAIDADPDLDLSAWTVGRGAKGLAVAEVPVFTDRETYEAGTDVPLEALPRRRAMASLLVGAANLSGETAFCNATLYDRAGGRLAEVAFEVAPLSLAREEALAKVGRGGRVEAVNVTCDQTFYPFAAAVDKSGLQPTIAAGTGPNGSCDLTATFTKDEKSGNWVATSPPGIFHQASRANPKGILCLKTPQELRIGKAVFEWEFTAGPWSKRMRSGLHNLSYVFLDRYRGGVVANVNAAGPSKNILRFMQNVGMPRGSNTSNKASYELEQSFLYRAVYTFDANNKTATLQVFLRDLEVKKFSAEVKPGNNQTLVVRRYGRGDLEGLAMVAEFGNNNGQHLPEVESWEWLYGNFRVEMTPKN